jgi:hypothetical protein
VETSGTVVGTVRPPAKRDGGAVKIAYEKAEYYGFGFGDNDSVVMITYGHELANLLDYRINPKGKNGKAPGFVYGTSGIDPITKGGETLIAVRLWRIA